MFWGNQAEGGSDWVLIPLIPFNPLENDLRKDEYPPFPPSFKDSHFLSTDTTGKSVRILPGPYFVLVHQFL